MNTESEHKQPDPDDQLRQTAAAHLSAPLDRNARLIERCEALASAQRGDRIGALNAAARIMRADAALAAMFARVARIETRHRSFSETNQMTKADKAELNAKKIELSVRQDRFDQEKVWRKLDEHVENAIKARTGDPDAHDRIKWVLDEIEEWKERDRKSGEHIYAAPGDEAAHAPSTRVDNVDDEADPEELE